MQDVANPVTILLDYFKHLHKRLHPEDFILMFMDKQRPLLPAIQVSLQREQL